MASRTYRCATTTLAKRSGTLAFACKRCGRCCRVFHINVTDADIRRIVLATGLGPADFVALREASAFECEEKEDGLKTARGDCIPVLREKDGRCIFLTRHKMCLIYEWRPVTCRLFPFEVKDGHLSTASQAVRVCKGVGGPGFVKAADYLAWWEQSCREDEEYERKVQDWNRLVTQHRVKPLREHLLEFLDRSRSFAACDLG